MKEIDETLDNLEKRLSPDMSLGQREMVLVRLGGLPRLAHVHPRALKISEYIRALDERDFAPLRAKLEAGAYTPSDFRAQIADIRDYDLDGWARRLFGLYDVPANTIEYTSEMVGHVTTHTIQVLEMASEMGPSDVFYDLGCGVGFVSILLSWLTGAKSVGIELEPAYVELARARAAAVGVQGRVRFVHGDLREQSYDEATAIFMFYPCRGAMLDAVLAKIEAGVRGRNVKLYSLGLSSAALVARPWVKVRGQSPSGLVALET